MEKIKQLSRTAMMFASSEPESDIYRLIADALTEILAGSVVFVSLFDPEDRTLKFEAISGSGKSGVKKFRDILGWKDCFEALKINDEAYAGLLTGKLIKVPGRSRVGLFNLISERQGEQIDELFSIDGIYVAGFVKGKRLYGSIAILTNENCRMEDSDFVQIFIDQASLALQHRVFEEVLMDKEEKFHSLTGESAFGYGELDSSGRLIQVNRELERITGYSRKALIGKNFRDILNPEDVAMAQQNFEEVLKKPIKKQSEYAMHSKSGELKHLAINSIPLRKRGAIVGVMFTCTDITRRKNIEKKLNRYRDSLEQKVKDRTDKLKREVSVRKIAEKKYRNLYEYSNDAIFLYDFSGNIFDINRKAVALLGYGKKELANMTIGDLHPAGNEKIHRDVFKELKKKGRANFKIRFKKKNGKMIIADVKAKLFEIEGQKIIQSVVRNITRQEDMMQALRESEERFRTLSGTPSAAIFIHQGGRFTFFNKTTMDISGYSRKELENMNFFDLVHPDLKDIVKKRGLARLRGGQPSQNYDIKIMAKNGKEKWLNISGSRITVSGEPAVIGTAFDITEKKTAEERLKKNRELLSSILDNIPFDMFVLDRTGRYILQNNVSRELWGDILGKRPEDVAKDSGALKLWKANNRKAMSGKIVKGEVSFPVNGEERYFYNVIAPIMEDGKAGGILGVNVDITERKKAEKALAESERKFKETSELLPQAIFEMEMDGRLTYANRASYAIFGYPHSEKHEEYRYLDFIAPEDRKRAMDNVKARIDGVKPVHTEYTAMRKDGTRFPVMAFAAPIIRDGKPVGLRGLLVDITERKHIEHALRESEQKFRSLAENSPNMIFINRSGNVVYANGLCEKQTGYSRKELYDKEFDFRKLIADRYIGGIEDNFRKHMQGRDVPAFEYALKTKTGKEIPVIISTKLIDYEGKKAILGVLTDITERKRAEKALSASEKRYRSVVQDQTELICRYSKGWKLTFVNDAYCEYFKMKRENILAQSFMPFIIEEDIKKVKDNLKRLSRENPVESHVQRVLTPEGDIAWQRWTNRAIFDEEGNITEIQAVGRDITEQKKAETELVQAQKLASIGQFAAGLAHEINNPLSALSGEVQWLMENVKDEKLKKSLNFMLRVSDRIAAIVTNLLFFSRETSKTSKKYAEINLMVEQSLALIKRRLKLNNIKIKKKLDETLPSVYVNVGQIEQVFLNIFFNSLHAMEKKGGRLSVVTAFNTKKNTVDTIIEDTGVGISDEHLNRIFDPFFTRKENGEGTGLGLSVSHGIIKEHGGTISIESEVGAGTSVTVSIPVKPDE